MKLLIIMAQLLSLTSFFAVILINYHLWRTANSSLSDEYLQDETTYDELYQSGMQSYTNEDWMGTVFYFERALQEFHYYRSSLTECRLKCQNLSLIATSENDPLSELKVFEAVFKKADCTRRCKMRKLGGRSERIDDSVTDKFLSMTPYSYLQFAYYKNGMYEKAILAAYTYLQWHSDDEVMQNNLDYYRNMHGIDETKLINLEEKVQQKHFLDAYQAHQDESWSKVITDMELALVEYWKADAQCRALCEGKYDNREFMDLYEAIANHYASTLYCKEQCESWLARINGKQVEDYLPSHFHFLQFAYYKVGDLQNAVKNALAYLLFHPSDEVMLQNMAFYENMDDLQMDFIPRKEAEEYHERAVLEGRMLAFAKRNFWNENAEEYLYPDRDYDEEDESELAYLGAEPIDPMEVNLKQNEGADMMGDLGLLSDLEEEDGEAMRRILEKQSHENERGSAKYSRDLNHGSQTATPVGAPHPEDTTSSEGRMGSSTRTQILTGMKKIMQSLMGSSEEESEQLLLQLAQDPKSREIKDRIKVAIEKMMANGNVDKDSAREQLKTMIQGLSQRGLIYDHKKEMEEKSRDVENFDPAAIHRDRKDVVYPSNKPSEMLDIKDYNPTKGLDKEYFDWVNPPGYEAGAPGSSPEDEEEDEENIGDYIEDDEEDEFEQNQEYYPSDDDETSDKKRTKHESVHQERDNEDTENKDSETSKSIETESLDGSSAGETHINDDSQGNQAPDTASEEKEEEEGGRGGREEEGEKEDVKNTRPSEKQLPQRQECSCSQQSHHDTRSNPYTDYIREKMEEQMCSLEKGDDEDSCGHYGDDEDEEEKRLSAEEAKLQRILDGEGMTDETREWMEEMMKIEDNAYFLLDDLTDLDVVMTDEELKGTNRVVADGLAADQECGVLLQLLDGEAKTGSGYKGKPSPHTKHESYEGLTVNDAVEAASEGRIPLLYPTIYMHLAERSRQFLQRYFQLKSHLFFSFTHLVCRQSRPDSNRTRTDLSHPVHADNCNLDRTGNCHKKLPAFVWRDWSAILYLNEDFEGGEFIFAHFNQTAQSVVTPHCGRLVGFSSGSENLHGVKGVIRGRRCALAMWFTLDPRFRELEFFKAADKLNTLYEEQYTKEGYYGNQ